MNGSLYERLGGKDAITAVIDDFVARCAADTRINAKFIRTDIPRLKTNLVDQVCQATGGPRGPDRVAYQPRGGGRPDGSGRLAGRRGRAPQCCDALVAAHLPFDSRHQEEGTVDHEMIPGGQGEIDGPEVERLGTLLVPDEPATITQDDHGLNGLPSIAHLLRQRRRTLQHRKRGRYIAPRDGRDHSESTQGFGGPPPISQLFSHALTLFEELGRLVRVRVAAQHRTPQQRKTEVVETFHLGRSVSAALNEG